MRHVILFVVLVVVGMVGPNAMATEEKPLFSSHDVLEMSLSVDFDALCRPNEVEGCKYSATSMTLVGEDGSTQLLPVEIRVRGGWRARKSHCDVPPLFVRFTSDTTEDTPFAGQGMLPLTTHCRSRLEPRLNSASGKDYEQYVLREYMGYRLYNLITDRSLRVRQVRINYRLPGSDEEMVSRYAFFTEHFDDMAARHEARAMYDKSFDEQRVDLASTDQVALFNFMIGNTDASIVRERNVVLIVTEEGQQYPVPYDLDMSGLVDAEYNGVSPRLDFRDPKQRYYLGFCHPGVDFDSLFQQFGAQQQYIIAMFDDIQGMSWSSRKQSRSYLNKFFKLLDSSEHRQEKIIEACHPWPPSPEDHTSPPEAA
jgi:hypothetical protein